MSGAACCSTSQCQSECRSTVGLDSALPFSGGEQSVLQFLLAASGAPSAGRSAVLLWAAATLQCSRASAGFIGVCVERSSLLYSIRWSSVEPPLCRLYDKIPIYSSHHVSDVRAAEFGLVCHDAGMLKSSQSLTAGASGACGSWSPCYVSLWRPLWRTCFPFSPL